MSGVNVNISISSLPQMDRHQDDMHRSPSINQQQNATIVKSEVSQRLNMPVEPDHAEGKTINLKNKLKIKEKNEKRNKKKNGSSKSKKRLICNNDGNFVDIQA